MSWGDVGQEAKLLLYYCLDYAIVALFSLFFFCPRCIEDNNLYGAGQPKPTLCPKFLENPGMLNYRHSRKNTTNDPFGNFAKNLFSKSLMAFILFSFH